MTETNSAPPPTHATESAPAVGQWEPRPGWQLLLIYIAFIIVGFQYRNPARLATMSAMVVLLYAVWVRFDLGGWIFGRLPTRMESAYAASAVEARTWPTIGLIFFIGCLIFLEWRQPLYFTQDDNLAQFLPGILQGCRGAMEGIFPTWNPYQYFGSPTTTVGTYALTYPPTYVSYMLARYVFGNEYLTVEIFCIGHLLVAYFVAHTVLRRLGVRPSVAMLATLCCVLSGFALLVGRSWFYMTPVFVFTPLLMLQTMRFAQGERGWRWIGMTALWLGLYFHAGNVQMWAYTVLLLGVAYLWLLVARVITWRSLFAAASALLLGLAISAPLLIPEYLVTRGVVRGAIHTGITKGLPTLLVPVSMVQTYHPNRWGAPYYDRLGELYYSGTIFMALAVVSLGALLLSRWRAEEVKQNLWVVPALVALLLALGADAAPWMWLSRWPGFSEFRSPVKLVAFITMFATFAGAVLLERLLRRQTRPLRLEMGLVAIVLALLLHHVGLSKASFFSYGARPYAGIEQPLLRFLQPADGSQPKFLPIAPERSLHPDYFVSLKHQFPSVVEVFSASGYDPLVTGDGTYVKFRSRLLRKVPGTLAQYGVRYVLIHEFTEAHVLPKWLELGPLVYQREGLRLYEIPGAMPMAFVESDPARSVPAKFDAGGVTLDTSGVSGTVILNMLWRPELQSRGGGALSADELGRTRIPVASTASVRLDFSPPWGWGWMAAGVFGVVGWGLGFVAQRKS